jgi:uncharacterized membrane protein YfcA
MEPWTNETLLLITCAFLLAGFVKGVVGFGLPTVGLVVLALFTGVVDAMALILVPATVTNLWQAMVGGHLLVILRRFWPLLAALCLGTWLSAGWLVGADALALSAALGLLLVLYAGVSLIGLQLPPPGTNERWWTPAVGFVNGLITGLTGTFVVPSVLYLQTLGLPAGQLIQTMGVFFLTASLALSFGLADHGLIAGGVPILSAVGVIPALLGMLMGALMRRWMPADVFRRVFFTALLLLGVYLAVRGFV